MSVRGTLRRLGLQYCTAASSGYTVSFDDNVEGLASAIALANSLLANLNSHGMDVEVHSVEPDLVNFPVPAKPATNLPTLISLVSALLAAFSSHEADARLETGRKFHNKSSKDHSIAAAGEITSLVDCAYYLGVLKKNYNSHVNDSSAHQTVDRHLEASTEVSYGATVEVSVVGVRAGDSVCWAILDDGTNHVTGISAETKENKIRFVFSNNPMNDTIISFASFGLM